LIAYFYFIFFFNLALFDKINIRRQTKMEMKWQ